MASVYGIDVSEHNGALDWAKIKAAGIKFAIIRSGYGVSHEDTQFQNNMKGALAQGIPVGVYHFSYALNAAGAKNEAAFVTKLLAPYKDKITLPVFFDFEYDTVSYAAKQGVTLGKQAFNDHTIAFCEAIKAAGYTPGVYYNLDYKNRFVNDDMVGDYIQWYAQYNTTASWTGWDIWQYSSKYTINGLSGYFDANVAPESFLEGKSPVAAGWKRNATGWWYQNEDSTFPASEWMKIDGVWYYFDADGYMASDIVMEYKGDLYWLTENGHMATSGEVVYNGVLYTVNPDGTLMVKEKEEAPMETARYNTLGEVKSETYRKTLNKLIDKGYLKGHSGEGEDRVIDLSEDSVRILVMLDRAGNFGE